MNRAAVAACVGQLTIDSVQVVVVVTEEMAALVVAALAEAALASTG